LIHQDTSIYSHEVDHIVALKHGGQTQADHLAVACLPCNRSKGSDLTTFDPSATLLCPCSTHASTPGGRIFSSRTPSLLVSPQLVGLPWRSSSLILQLAYCIVGCCWPKDSTHSTG
jgi:hypothetical protein